MAARVNYNKKILSGATKYSFILIIKLSYHGKGDAQTKNEQWRNLLMDCIPFMQTWLCSLCWRDPFTYKVKQLVFLLMVPDGRQISPWLQEVNLKVHKTFRRRFGFFLKKKKKKLKGELALAYESYGGGILIVILIEILNDYCFILY